MIGRLTLAAGLLALGILAAPHASSAASLTPLPAIGAGGDGLVQTVQWRSCRYWRQECARRWGWGSWRWRRCLAGRGCL